MMRAVRAHPMATIGLSTAVVAFALGFGTWSVVRNGTNSTSGPSKAQPGSARAQTLASFLDKPVPKGARWHESRTLLGTGYVVTLPQTGIFEVDPSGSHVILAVFVATPGSTRTINMAQGETIATS